MRRSGELDIVALLLDAVVETLPDQGIEKGEVSAAKKHDHREKEEKDPVKDDDKPGKGKKKCLVCGKKHTPFCKLPEGFRKNRREEDKKRKAEAKASAAAAAAKKSK